jgi:hypothetical protein
VRRLPALAAADLRIAQAGGRAGCRALQGLDLVLVLVDELPSWSSACLLLDAASKPAEELVDCSSITCSSDCRARHRLLQPADFETA